MTTTPTPAPTIAPPLTAEAEQRLRDAIASDHYYSVRTSQVRSLLASLDEARKDSKRLEEVRLAALNAVGQHCGAIPQAHLDNQRLEHAFVLFAHRILATGNPDGVSKGKEPDTDAAMSKKGSQ